jgi:dihydrofolate reductase
MTRRTVTYGAACSLDGFIAGPDGGLDWLHWSKDVSAVMGAYWPTVDTVLMGRKTWEGSTGGGGGGGGMPGVKAYVFSRTLTKAKGAVVVSEDPGGFVRNLTRRPGKDICVMGGGELAASLLAAGAIDEVGLNIHPVLLGSGVPLFRDTGKRIKLELRENRTLDGGCVLATYAVLR